MNTEMPHILAVDDDDRLRELLRKFLSENGFRVSAARDAADARDKLAALEFDLLVLDLMMPGENGLDFAADLRKTSSIPIL
ncbi:MAG: response regulator, partial [Rhodospirillales bacterium]|nr:response regulator [Rhodospirillales bacterium]